LRQRRERNETDDAAAKSGAKRGATGGDDRDPHLVLLMHDPEQGIPAFGKVHAQTTN
jgi:hypothetical protein